VISERLNGVFAVALESLIVFAIVLSAASVALGIVIVFRSARPANGMPETVQVRFQTLESAIARTDALIRDEFARGRDESSSGSRSLREEVIGAFSALSETMRNAIGDLAEAQRAKLDDFGIRINESRAEGSDRAKALREEVQNALKQLGHGIVNSVEALAKVQGDSLDGVTKQIALLTEGNEQRQDALRTNVEQKLGDLRTDAGATAKALREEVTGSLKSLGETLVQSINQVSEAQKERLDRVSSSLGDLTQRNVEQQEGLRKTLEERLDLLRKENETKLDQMRHTVDEKLQATLDQRFATSFKQVSDHLEQVYKSVGEMQTLATGVGDLKKVLSNIKARGTWGEVTLGNLLEQVMTPEQYAQNVEVQPGSGQRVEFAIRLPGSGDGETPLWLPIDAKFPIGDYERLVLASEEGDAEGTEIASKAIETSIKLAARDICDKYVHPPHTTDFGVMFLPTEGLFAEVLRRPGLVDSLQRDCRIIVTGPTTLMALLNSLRMGFRTLAIQRRSSEVWQVLAAVKSEFGRFEKVFDKVHKKLQEAQNVVERAGTRRRAVVQKLHGVEALPELKAAEVEVLNLGIDDLADEEPMPSAAAD
jgi:DNA recombination protein RmuC